MDRSYPISRAIAMVSVPTLTIGRVSPVSRGMPLPLAESLYDDIDVTSMTDEFIAWHADRHGGEPDPDVVEALATEWMEGALPETWYSVSPRRVAHRQDLVSDWNNDDPIAVAVKALLPVWATWLGERAGLPDHLTLF